MVAWLWCMFRARLAYRRLGFSARTRFLAEIRPPLKNKPGFCIAYPDAIFHVTRADLRRALKPPEEK